MVRHCADVKGTVASLVAGSCPDTPGVAGGASSTGPSGRGGRRDGEVASTEGGVISSNSSAPTRISTASSMGSGVEATSSGGAAQSSSSGAGWGDTGGVVSPDEHDVDEEDSSIVKTGVRFVTRSKII